MIVDSPYKGLAPFEDSELDALLFYGRERESEIIAANVLAARLTVLYAALFEDPFLWVGLGAAVALAAMPPRPADEPAPGTPAPEEATAAA